MLKSDQIRLRHMLEAARAAMSFAAGRRRPDLDGDTMLVFSLLRAIEIVGEAANNVSEELRNDHPEIPWGDMIGMRNRLIHAYHDVELDVVWQTVSEDLPPLIAALEEILS